MVLLKRESLMTCRFFSCFHFKFIVWLNNQLHKILLLSKNIFSHVFPKTLVSNKHLNIVAEKGTWEGCLKELPLERFGTSVEDVRESWYQVLGMLPQARFTYTFTGKQYVHEVDTLSTNIICLALCCMVWSPTEWNSVSGWEFLHVTKDAYLLGFK